MVIYILVFFKNMNWSEAINLLETITVEYKYVDISKGITGSGWLFCISNWYLKVCLSWNDMCEEVSLLP